MSANYVNRAIVLDFEGEQLYHPNGGRWQRILVKPEMAEELYQDLHQMFSPPWSQHG